MRRIAAVLLCFTLVHPIGATVFNDESGYANNDVDNRRVPITADEKRGKYSFVGLFINRGNDMIPDTGWVAYFRNIVVTTAHTFYKRGRWRKENGKRLSQEEFLFYTGNNRRLPNDQDSYKIKKIVYGTMHPYRDDTADFAIVVLDRNLPEYVRPARVMITNRLPDDLSNYEIVNVAYHMDVDGSVWPHRMRGKFRDKGKYSVHFSRSAIAYHGLNTSQSASGSPLLVELGNIPYVVAMHEGSFGRNVHSGKPYHPSRHFNYALRVKGDLLATLRRVIQTEHGIDIMGLE
ncbi:hypothetical protein ACFL1S_04180 [Pseudomonadota bacterium]